MNPVHYLVAKYIADTRRMEPRNIGVVVWSAGEVAARFAAERRDQPGEVDGRSLPSFVTSLSAYKQWVRFWRKELEKETIRPLAGGEPAVRTSADFLKVLTSTSKGNFLLTEGGMLLDPVAPGELADVADCLFGLLVEESPPPDEPRDPTLEDVCQQLFEETNVATLPYFRRNYSLQCAMPGRPAETFEFSYAYGNGTPLRLYQQLPLPKRRKALSRNVHHVAWMFEKVIAAGQITPEQGGVLVLPSDEQAQDREVERSLEMLGSITRVLNLRDYDRARSEFQGLAQLDTGHEDD